MITALGSPTFLPFALSLLFWLDERRSTATVAAYAFLVAGILRIAEFVERLSLESVRRSPT